jgi:hypothetical protein
MTITGLRPSDAPGGPEASDEPAGLGPSDAPGGPEASDEPAGLGPSDAPGGPEASDEGVRTARTDTGIAARRSAWARIAAWFKSLFS